MASPTDNPRSRVRRRAVLASGLASGGIGALAGCMQPLLEDDGEGAADEGTSDEQSDDADADSSPADEAEPEGESDLDLDEAWNVPDSFVPSGRRAGAFVGFELEAFALAIVSPDGELRWTSAGLEESYGWRTADDEAIALDQGHVFYGTLEHEDDPHAQLYGFSRESGDELWTHQTEDTGLERRIKGVTAGDERVYYGADAASGSSEEQEPVVRGLEAASGEPEWEHGFDDGFVQEVTYHDGHLYVQQSFEFHIFDAETGTLLDTLPHTVALRGFVTDGDLAYGVSEDVWEFDLDANDLRYETPAEREPDSRIGLDADRLYAGNDAGYLDAYERSDGSHAWSTRLDGGIRDRPTSNGEVVWVVDDTDVLYGLDATSGDVRYEWAPERVDTPVVVDDVLLVTVDGRAEAYEVDSP